MASIIKVSEILHPTANVPSLTINSDSTVSFDAGILSVTGPINGVIGANTPYSGTFTSLNNSGNLTFTGTGNRIRGDFSNATIANRVMFQNSTTNALTTVGVVPNGTASTSRYQLFGNSDPSNASVFTIGLENNAEARLNSGLSGTGTNLPMTIYTGGSERIRINTSGNVGIGTSSPVTLKSAITLQVNGNLKLGNANDAGLLSLGDIGSTGANAGVWRGAAGAYGSAGNFLCLGGFDGITFTTGNADISSQTERMRIDSSGNVGIGRAPNYALDVYRSGAGSPAIASSNDSMVTVLQSVSTTQANVGTLTSHPLVFITGNTERVRIDTSGNVGIGTTSLTSTFTVQGTPAAGTVSFKHGGNNSFGTILTLETIGGTDDPVLSFKNYNGGSPAYYGIACTDNGALGFRSNASTGSFGDERMRLTSAGDLLVGGTSSPALARIYSKGASTASEGICVQEVSGGGSTRFYVGFYNSSNTKTGDITTTGTTTAYNTTSDYRLKNTITPMTGALSKIALLKPCIYKWNLDGSVGEGFIAHELAEVCPNAVVGDKDAVDKDGNPQYQGVDTSFLVATLVAAIQELKAEVDALKNK